MIDAHAIPIELRRAAPSDAPTLTALARAAKSSWGYPEKWMEAWTSDLTIGADYIDSHRVMIAYTSTEIFGMCALEDQGSHWMLEHVWIAPRVHGRGVGRALVLDALAAAHTAPVKPVRVISDPFALKFYARLGASVIGWVAAPMDGDPARVLPLMEFSTGVPRA
jgi:N-acetylglutamate synthase-like GNAT family acetyltransferase